MITLSIYAPCCRAPLLDRSSGWSAPTLLRGAFDREYAGRSTPNGLSERLSQAEVEIQTTNFLTCIAFYVAGGRRYS